jgi:hypothetical protein
MISNVDNLCKLLWKSAKPLELILTKPPRPWH